MGGRVQCSNCCKPDRNISSSPADITVDSMKSALPLLCTCLLTALANQSVNKMPRQKKALQVNPDKMKSFPKLNKKTFSSEHSPFIKSNKNSHLLWKKKKIKSREQKKFHMKSLQRTNSNPTQEKQLKKPVSLVRKSSKTKPKEKRKNTHQSKGRSLINNKKTKDHKNSSNLEPQRCQWFKRRYRSFLGTFENRKSRCSLKFVIFLPTR